ncbi:hypothetical protein GJ744_001955 [Endocarpon pusillum]|uniref:MRH domain-containing protein n=1 Tax=Endocarpon pusillum TaxID=364733 RepID=A0A8H7AAZ6_9EURO|nr:hypothetical protein GJ744_001955 [Endocarpon pusillum]
MIASWFPLSMLALTLTLLPPLLPSTVAADSKPAAKPKPCTIHSPSTGSYYDLRPLDLSLQQQQQSGAGSNSKSKDSRTDSWHAKGYDYAANFSLNICGPVIETLQDVDGVPAARWKNVSAFYRLASKTHSIGQMNSELVFRGRSLVLNYTGGSPCPELDEDGNPAKEAKSSNNNLRARKIIDDDDDDNDNNDDPPSRSKQPKSSSSKRRKSSLISLHCDRSPTLSTHPSLSFIGTTDHCVYAFEARSRYFCGGATASSDEPGSMGPGGIFGVIIVIALLAYLVGGCAYQRIVMRQRGWKQCPNYAVWSGIVEFVKDIFTILFSTCTRHLPSFGRAFNSRGRSGGGRSAGYHRVGANANANGSAVVGAGRTGAGTGMGRGRVTVNTAAAAEDDAEENRLIDQLDEEWDD